MNFDEMVIGWTLCPYYCVPAASLYYDASIWSLNIKRVKEKERWNIFFILPSTSQVTQVLRS